MIAWLQARAWQLGTIVTGLLAAFLALQLLAAKIDNRHLGKMLKGANADLVTAKTNASLLDAALKRQNLEFKSAAAAAEAKIAAAEAKLVVAQRNTADAQKRAAALLAFQPKGANECEKMLDVDRQIIEGLK